MASLDLVPTFVRARAAKVYERRNRDTRRPSLLHGQDVIRDLRARPDPDVGRIDRLLDDLLVIMRAAVMTEDMRMAGHVDDAQLVTALARDVDHLVERIEHHRGRIAAFHRRPVIYIL